MFLGHFAVAFGAKRAAPRLSLGMTFLACQFADLLWAPLVLLGVERAEVEPGATAFTPLDLEHYPWSHSVGMSLIWAAVLGVGVAAWRRSRREGLVVGAVLLSHCVLDIVAHRPDVPLWFGDSRRLGLGLWNSVPLTLLVEGGLFAAGVFVYARATRPADRAEHRARWGLPVLVAFLLLVYAVVAFGPPPPEGAPPLAFAGPALALWILVAWAARVDRARCAARVA